MHRGGGGLRPERMRESNGTDLARQACQHVERSLTLYQASLHAASPRGATSKQAQAVAQLRDALPMAATVAGEAGQYQALMATLAQSDHLPESLLVHALGAQCAAADSNGGLIPTPPPTAETPATHPPPTRALRPPCPAPSSSGSWRWTLPTGHVNGAGFHPCQGVWYTAGGRTPNTAVIAAHYSVDFSEHYLAPLLAGPATSASTWSRPTMPGRLSTRSAPTG